MPTLIVHFVDADARVKVLQSLDGLDRDASYVAEYGNFVILEDATESMANDLRRHPLVESVEEDHPLEPFRLPK